MADLEVVVDPAVQAAHPTYAALVLVAAGLRDGPTDAGSDAQLAAAERALQGSGLQRAADDAADDLSALVHERWPDARLDRIERVGS